MENNKRYLPIGIFIAIIIVNSHNISIPYFRLTISYGEVSYFFLFKDAQGSVLSSLFVERWPSSAAA